jgi:hypothetical protein
MGRLQCGDGRRRGGACAGASGDNSGVFEKVNLHDGGDAWMVALGRAE